MERSIVLTGKIHCFDSGENEIGLIVSGAGKKNARAAVEKLCNDFTPNYIISSGICGAAKQSLNIGDIVVAEDVHYGAGYLTTDSNTTTMVKTILTKHQKKYQPGTFQTVDQVLLSTREIREDVTTVDMESYAIIEEANKRETPIVAVRVISDIVPKKEPIFAAKQRARYRIFFRNFETAKTQLDELFSVLCK